MNLSPLIAEVVEPVIVDVNRRAAERRRQGREVLDLGQGVPDLTPPEDCLAVLRHRLAEPQIHRYAPDPGLPELREAVAEDLRRRTGVEIDPSAEVIVTVGANHAFCQAALTCLGPGAAVALPTPAHFNHPMALQMLGFRTVEWPMRLEKGAFRLDLDALPTLAAAGVRGVVCVNPNNPTGAVYPREDVRRLVEWVRDHGLTLFYDEVYHLLDFSGLPAPHPFQVDGGRECTVILGSFSKVFGMTGWRVGYLAAPAAAVREMLKVQDTLVICAPRPAQVLAVECLRRHPDFPAGYRQALRQRAAFLAGAFAGVPGVTWHPPSGAIFGMLGVTGCRDSRALGLDLLEAEGVVTIPGAAFGPAGEGMLRVSFGFADEAVLGEACVRIGRRLEAHRSR
ncbi:MAG: pyridoxal phosphate-dependent aminotransferase [Acidobacteria bacterium]|nr:pyridoxal phosphate-dependent aminotransferase [Acidobacteriota bacterium]